MKGLCIDSSGSEMLKRGEEYFLFPLSPTAYYVSKFNKESSYFGAYTKARFAVMEEVAPDSEPVIELEPSSYDQLTIFDALEAEKQIETVEFYSLRAIVPADVISPLDCTDGVKTKKFNSVRARWADYAKAIQDEQKCSWFEACRLLAEHRDNETPIQMAVHIESKFRPENIIEGAMT